MPLVNVLNSIVSSFFHFTIKWLTAWYKYSNFFVFFDKSGANLGHLFLFVGHVAEYLARAVFEWNEDNMFFDDTVDDTEAQWRRHR